MQVNPMPPSLKYNRTHHHSVAHLLKVVAQRGDVAEGDGGLGVFAVVADEEGLCGFVDDDAFFALFMHQLASRGLH
jgi:hypothetical protein